MWAWLLTSVNYTTYIHKINFISHLILEMSNFVLPTIWSVEKSSFTITQGLENQMTKSSNKTNKIPYLGALLSQIRTKKKFPQKPGSQFLDVMMM